MTVLIESAPRLLGDIGGTNARFALQSARGPVESLEVYETGRYPSLTDAVRNYLSRVAPLAPPRHAAFAVASPVTGERIALTNNVWSFSISDVKRDLGLSGLHVVNDFVAVALSILRLGPEDVRQIGGGEAVPATPIAAIGPGTGLGVSALVPAETGWVPLAAEGGHVTMPAYDAGEDAVIARLRKRLGHVSAERVLSGPGLVNLHFALAEIAGRPPEHLTSDEISRRALVEGDPACRETFDTFCAMLGTVAGNLALTLGARGGVFIAGGIVPDFAEAFAASAFRERFEEKGRFRDYLSRIPTFVITRDLPAFVGLSTLLDAAEQGTAPRPG